MSDPIVQKSTNLMKKGPFTSFLMLLGVFITTVLVAQTNVNMPYNNGPVTFTIAPPSTCSFNFYDNGGPAGQQPQQRLLHQCPGQAPALVP